MANSLITKLIPRSGFARNVLKLMTGTVISQAIAVLMIPVIARLYSPEDYGIFTRYFGIVMIVSVIITFRYDQMIVLQKKKKDAINLLVLALMITVAVSLLSFIIVLIAPETVSDLLKTEGIGIWLIYLPLSFLLFGIFQILENYLLRKKDFNKMRAGTISQSFTKSIVNIALGLFSYIKGGLIFGYIAGQIVVVIIYSAKRFKSLYLNIRKYFEWNYCLELARKYRKTVLPLIPTNVLGSLTNYMPFFILSTYTSGIYGMCFNIVNLPMLVIGKALSDVSFKHTIDIINSGNSLAEYIEKIFARLLVFAILPVLLLALFAQPLFTFILGAEWRMTGLYVQILLPYFFFRFITYPITLFVQTGKTHILLYWQILALLLTVTALMAGKIFILSDVGCIILLSIASSFSYFVMVLINFKISGAKILNTIKEIRRILSKLIYK